MKHLVIALLMVMFFVASASANVTIRQYMNEKNNTTKEFFAAGLQEGLITSYIITARGAKVSEEKIQGCLNQFTEINSGFPDFMSLTNFLIQFHLDSGGKTDDLLSVVISNSYLNNDTCKFVTKEEIGI